VYVLSKSGLTRPGPEVVTSSNNTTDVGLTSPDVADQRQGPLKAEGLRLWLASHGVAGQRQDPFEPGVFVSGSRARGLMLPASSTSWVRLMSFAPSSFVSGSRACLLALADDGILAECEVLRYLTARS
jgi:hypothetical protein